MDVGPRTPPRRGRVALTLLALLACAGFVALGVWQLERRAWKLDLIARVERLRHAPPAAAPGPGPGPGGWAGVAPGDVYRPLVAVGTFAHDKETPVQAVTDYGPGYWIVTPLRTDGGWWLLVNRGFVPSDQRAADARPAGQVAGKTVVSGLLRASEPGGAFLRHNDPAGNRWYSRDVAAIARARGLPPARVAPYFLDADAASGVPGGPRGGLTVVRFRNSHLQYALTWFGLALLPLVAVWLLWRRPPPGRAA